MTDKTMAKLRSLLKTYEERAAKARPEPKTVDEEGERRREECGERLQQVVLPVLQARSEEHTSELQSLAYLVCRLLLEKKKKNKTFSHQYIEGQFRYSHKLAMIV